jgi:putative Mg2+ transporter-C (MgtC) family protein
MTLQELRDAGIPLLVALAFGATIGLNRDLHHKPAGFRTFGLVAVGSAVITLVAARMGTFDVNAVSRVMQGIVTGIGFLGAGVILHRDGGRVKGLTTAAAVWTTAGLGVACALALYAIALAGWGVTMLVLYTGGPIERFCERIAPRSPAPPGAGADELH